MKYFAKSTLSHLKPQQGLSERYQRRVIDVTLAAKLTLTYGKYHLAMLHRQLATSTSTTTVKKQTTMNKHFKTRPTLLSQLIEVFLCCKQRQPAIFQKVLLVVGNR